MTSIDSKLIIQAAKEDSQLSFGSRVWSSLKRQQERRELCDVVIKCGSSNIHAQRAVLAATCPYFQALFLGSFTPEMVDGVCSVELNEFSESSVKLLIDLLYEVENPQNLEVDCSDFLQLLDFVQVDSYLDIMGVVMREKIDIDNCLQVFEVSHLYNAKKLQRLCEIFIGSHFLEVIKNQHWGKLSLKSIADVLRSDTIRCQPLESLENALKMYLLSNLESIKSMLSDNISTIDGQNNNMNIFTKDDLSDSINVRKDYLLEIKSNESREGPESIVMYRPYERVVVLGQESTNRLEGVFPRDFHEKYRALYFIFRQQLHAALYGRFSCSKTFSFQVYDQLQREYHELFTIDEFEETVKVADITNIFSDPSGKSIIVVFLAKGKKAHVPCAIRIDMDSCSILGEPLFVPESFLTLNDEEGNPQEEKEFFVIHNCERNEILMIDPSSVITCSLESGDVTNHNLRIENMPSKQLMDYVSYVSFKGDIFCFYFIQKQIDDMNDSENEDNNEDNEDNSGDESNQTSSLSQLHIVKLDREHMQWAPLLSHKLNMYIFGVETLVANNCINLVTFNGFVDMENGGRSLPDSMIGTVLQYDEQKAEIEECSKIYVHICFSGERRILSIPSYMLE